MKRNTTNDADGLARAGMFLLGWAIGFVIITIGYRLNLPDNLRLARGALVPGAAVHVVAASVCCVVHLVVVKKWKGLSSTYALQHWRSGVSALLTLSLIGISLSMLNALSYTESMFPAFLSLLFSALVATLIAGISTRHRNPGA